MQNELNSLTHKMNREMNKYYRKNEKIIGNIKDEINKRLNVEEKRMQEFLIWKENEIEKIRRLENADKSQFLTNDNAQETKLNNNTHSTTMVNDKLSNLRKLLLEKTEMMTSKDDRDYSLFEYREIPVTILPQPTVR